MSLKVPTFKKPEEHNQHGVCLSGATIGDRTPGVEPQQQRTLETVLEKQSLNSVHHLNA